MVQKSVKVFIIDDTPSTLDVICELLSDEGYTNLIALGTPPDAIDVIRNFDDVAIVISDYSMPDINGLELLRLVTAKNSSLYGIVITADPGSVPVQSGYPVLEKGAGLFNELLELLSFYTVEQKATSV